MIDIKKRNKYRNECKKKKRQKLILRFGGKCSICGSKKFLEFHHKTMMGLPSGGIAEREEYWIEENINEIQLLCKSCHTKIHWPFKKRYKKRPTVSPTVFPTGFLLWGHIE